MSVRRSLGLCAVALLVAVTGIACKPAVPKPVQVAIANTHGCAVMDDHTVRCWGNNRNGQLGNGAASGVNTDASTAVTVSGLKDAKTVAVGDFYSCALRTTGAVSCWGVGRHGRLGNGTDTQSTVPVAVTGITNATSIGITNGATYPATCASLATGGVKCWGSNLYGVLGVSSVPNTTTGSSNVPVTVTGVTGVAEVAVGANLACARHTTGTATCWGRNSTNVFDDPALPPGNQDTVRLPSAILGLTGATSLTVGNANVCAMTGGVAKCWGSWDGPSPVAVDDGLGFTSIAATTGACGVTAAKKAYCYGPNQARQIGDPALPLTSPGTPFATPYRVLDPTSVKGLPSPVKALGAGYLGSCAVLDNAQVWCWGSNTWGAVGTGAQTTGSSDTGLSPSRVVGI